MTEREALKIALQAFKTIDEAMPFPVAKLAQSAIKEALAQPEQEPVAQRDDNERGNIRWLFGPQVPDKAFLYTTPPQRKPLTDEEIDAIPFRALEIGPTESFREFARAIEAAHGIGGEA